MKCKTYKICYIFIYIFIQGILLICYNIFVYVQNFMGLHGCSVVKNPPVIQPSGQTCQRSKFDPWVKNIPWRRKQQPTPVTLPGESHGQESLVDQSPWGHSIVTKQQKILYICTIQICVRVCVLSSVQLFVTPQTVACQAPLTMEFSRQKY